METEAMIRYCCSPYPSDELAFPYAVALSNTGMGVRVVPVGILDIFQEPWNTIPELFVSAMRHRFINIVRVPPGAQGSPGIADLFTVGVPNICILGEGEIVSSEKERAVLLKYDRVLCPTDEGVAALEEIGASVSKVPPDPQCLLPVLSAMHVP